MNMGDSYASQPSGSKWTGGDGAYARRWDRMIQGDDPRQEKSAPGLKPKDLVGIPWRLAFALQADGWYLRSDIIWHKPNPMPEIRDRPADEGARVHVPAGEAGAVLLGCGSGEGRTTRHVRKIVQGTRYPAMNKGRPREAERDDDGTMTSSGFTDYHLNPAGRNIPHRLDHHAAALPEAHFATFPVELARRCIEAGTSEKGACPTCGKAWERVVEA